jgi:tetratricopeptide (TPR) repeat protein
MKGELVMKTAITIFVLLFVSGCASSLEKGNSAYKNRQYLQAANHYAVCAKQGNSTCINNLGYIHYLAGNTDKAIAHYKLSARFGNEYAINNLKELGESVPYPDLASYQSQNKAPRESNELIQLLGFAGKAYSESSDRRRNCTSMILGDIIQTNCR